MMESRARYISKELAARNLFCMTTVCRCSIEHCAQEWEARSDAIVEELREANPDIIALQEVQ